MPALGRALAVPTALVAITCALYLQFETELQYGFERDTTVLEVQKDIQLEDYKRTTVYFTSQGIQLEGWVYEPQPAPKSPPPIVVMGHGLGAQKDMGLHPYAEQFAQAGMAVLVFDYRGFGGSDGEPRHWVSWGRHLQDWQAALDFVSSGGLAQQGYAHVDVSRIALWGVSYSGGHVLVTAAKEGNKDKIKAVVANEPYLSSGATIGKAFQERGVLQVVRLLVAAAIDKASELLGLSPVYVKLVAPFGHLAVLNMNPQEYALSRGAQPNPPRRVGGWKNICTARMLVDNLGYKPIRHVSRVAAPTLLVVGTKDEITPPAVVYQAKSIMGDRATLLEKPYGHLEMHRKGAEPHEVAPVIDFLRSHLGLSPTHVDTLPHEADVRAEADAEVV